MNGKERDTKGRQVNMRMDPAMEEELHELRELASVQIVQPTMTDILRAAIKAGIPILRADLLRSRALAAQPEDQASDAQAGSSPAARTKQSS